MKNLKRFLIIANSLKEEARNAAKDLEDYIESRGLSAEMLISDDRLSDGLIPEDVLSRADAAIVLGGDGTMLRAVHLARKHPVPMIGVNFGTMGFLTDADIRERDEMIDRLSAGDYQVEDRMLLEGSIIYGRKGAAEAPLIALNDIVVSRSRLIRLIAIRIYVNDEFFDEYEADGIIVSTPTGSTGYNLSSGGPIVNPKTNLMVITPIAPHALSKKSVVFDSSDRIEIELMEKRKLQENSATVSFDGCEDFDIEAHDKVRIRRSGESVSLIRLSDDNFFVRMRNKIRS